MRCFDAVCRAAFFMVGLLVFIALRAHAAEPTVSPQQSIEKMAQLQKEIDPPYSSNEIPHVVVSGTLKTADNQPLPRKRGELDITAYSRSPRTTAAYSIALDAEGRFSQKVNRGSIILMVRASGYAPLIVGPLTAKSDGTLDPLDLVLTKGFRATIRLADPQANLVPNAKVTLSYQREDKDNFCLSQDFTTDSTGTITVPHAIDRPGKVVADIPGFQHDLFPVTLSADKPTFLMLLPAKPATGIVRDDKNNPLPNASVALISRKGFENQTWYPHPEHSKPPVLTTTDASGRFTLTSLRDGTDYVLRISAAGRASVMIAGVRSGRDDIAVTLPPERPIEVHLLTDPGAKLPKTVSVSNPLVLESTNYSYGYDIPVKTRDGVARAVLADPLPSRVTFTCGGKTVSVDPADFQNPIVLDLRKKDVPPQAKRTVVLRLDLPKDAPPPQGKIRLDYIRPEYPSGYFSEELPLKNGEARFDVPVPTKIGYQQGTMIGYVVQEKHDIEVPQAEPGADPFVVTIPATASGAVHGKILKADGSPHTTYFYASVHVIKPAPGLPQNERGAPMQGFNSNSGSSQFLLSPLALGGTYRISVKTSSPDASLALSDEFTVDDKQPLRELNIQLEKGIPLTGAITLPDGSPAANVEVELATSMDFPNTSYGHGTAVRTDREGKFRIDNVPSKLPVRFSLSIKPGQTTQGRTFHDFVPDDKPFQVQLEAGLSATGTVINDETNQPVANLKIRLAAPHGKPQYAQGIETTTDAKGQFHFANLEPLTYNLYTNDAYPPGTTFTRHPNGSLTIHHSQKNNPTITGETTPAPLEVRVVLPPIR